MHEIAIKQDTTQVGMPSPQELMVYQTWAKTAFDSNMYRGIGKESGIMMVMLAAREYGIGPVQALNGGINIIEGKVELSARLMGAMIRRAGHTMQILESTDEKCRILGKRADTGEEYIAEFTIEQAQRAGLVKEKGAWKRTPDDMLFARAQSKLARRLFSDVIGIGYVQGEISQQSEDLEPSCESCDYHQIDLSEEQVIEELYQLVNEEDKGLLVEYITIVAKHYNKTLTETAKQFLENKDKTFISFNKWKEKR